MCALPISVEPKALLFKQSRAVGADSVTACAETDGRLACFLSDPVTQSDDFCALPRFGPGADIAVCSRNGFFMGRIAHGMEIGSVSLREREWQSVEHAVGAVS